MYKISSSSVERKKECFFNDEDLEKIYLATRYANNKSTQPHHREVFIRSVIHNIDKTKLKSLLKILRESIDG